MHPLFRYPSSTIRGSCQRKRSHQPTALGHVDAACAIARPLTCRNVQLEAEEHKKTVHPYAPFPVERLEAAVTAVPLEAFPAVERELACFGPAYRFWCVRALPGWAVLSAAAGAGVHSPWLVAANTDPIAHVAFHRVLHAKVWVTGTLQQCQRPRKGHSVGRAASVTDPCCVLARRDGLDDTSRSSSSSSNGAGTNGAAFTPPDAPVDSMADLSRFVVTLVCCLQLYDAKVKPGALH